MQGHPQLVDFHHLRSYRGIFCWIRAAQAFPNSEADEKKDGKKPARKETKWREVRTHAKTPAMSQCSNGRKSVSNVGGARRARNRGKGEKEGRGRKAARKRIEEAKSRRDRFRALPLPVSLALTCRASRAGEAAAGKYCGYEGASLRKSQRRT
jgi:hypothetical protein